VPRPTAEGPVLVEFMGPSGVGKTTWAKKIASDMDTRESFARWGGLYLAGASPDSGFADTAHRKNLELRSLYTELMLSKRRNLPNSLWEPAHWEELMQFLQKIVDEDCALMERELKGGIFLRDEGLFHNFSEEIATLFQSRRQPLEFSRRLVVLVTADPSVVATRALARQHAGDTRLAFKEKAFHEAEELTRAS
jgi:hypothetical protein